MQSNSYLQNLVSIVIYKQYKVIMYSIGKLGNCDQQFSFESMIGICFP